MLDGAREPVLAGGHTHFAMVRRFDDALIVNPGSVGLPFAKREQVMRISPWAEYAILEWDYGDLLGRAAPHRLRRRVAARAHPVERNAARRVVGGGLRCGSDRREAGSKREIPA